MSNFWTDEEDEALIQFRVNNNLSYARIAGKLPRRTVNAVRHRWEQIRDNINLNKVLLGSKARSGGPKILIYDIETSPMLAYTWNIYSTYIRPENIAKDWYVISWAAKWLHDKEVIGEVLTPDEAKNDDDRRIVSKLWALFDEADIIVAHNGDKFDNKKMNWRFLYHGFPPPLSYKTIDTVKIARKYFSATSNKLDYLTDKLSLSRKTDSGGLDSWIECMRGDAKALKEMLKYNLNDVRILETMYLKLLPWITNHPNLGLFDDREVLICPACGSDSLQVVDKVSTTAVNAYRQYRCKVCSHVGRTKIHATTKGKRKETVSN